MKIKNILTQQMTQCGIPGGSKKRVLENLSTFVTEQLGGDGDQADSLFHNLVARERLGSTGIGEGVAIPHCRVAGFNRIHGCLIKLDNAIDFAPAGSRVQVELAGSTVAVQDSGPGIAPEHIPRLTERFYRVDRSRSRDTGGTGLGLAIVKHVAQRHGAELRIDSTPGKGSRFAIVFPASRVRLAAQPAAMAAV